MSPARVLWIINVQKRSRVAVVGEGVILAKTIGVGVACPALCEFRKPRCPGFDWHRLLAGDCALGSRSPGTFTLATLAELLHVALSALPRYAEPVGSSVHCLPGGQRERHHHSQVNSGETVRILRLLPAL
jgi:hypothetical protein